VPELFQKVASALGGGTSQLHKRMFLECAGERIHTHGRLEFMRLATERTRWRSMFCQGEQRYSIISVFRDFDLEMSRRLNNINVDAVHCCEGAALNTFKIAKKRGVKCFYEIPSSYWWWARDLLSEEADMHPELQNTLPNSTDPMSHLQWKDDELELADYVFVPSNHVKNTLEGTEAHRKTVTLNYGAQVTECYTPKPKSIGRLKVIFVGNLGQHKGIGYLIEAVSKMHTELQLKIIGRRVSPNPIVDKFLMEHEWIESLPHKDVMREMKAADVLVLPSLTEGCALVCLEAIACGTPVIVTKNTGIVDVISGGGGIEIPIRDSEAIVEAITLLNRDRDMLEQMSADAYVAAVGHSWGNYRKNWCDALVNRI